MTTIKGFTTLMLILVPIGATVRITLCLIYAAAAEDPASYKKKAINALVYAILAETVTGIIRVVTLYFGGSVVY